MTIVKVQVPLMSTDPTNPALIYAEHRQGMTQQLLDPVVLEQMNGAPKAFFEAHLGADGWIIGERVPDQNW